MNLRLYRSLYWANQGLINAAREIREMSRQPGIPRTELQDLEAIIEETRVAMNSLLRERIDRRDTTHPSRLQLIRFPREKASASLTREENVSTNGWNGGPSGREKVNSEVQCLAAAGPAKRSG